jgi:hypothetical protein
MVLATKKLRHHFWPAGTMCQGISGLQRWMISSYTLLAGIPAFGFFFAGVAVFPFFFAGLAFVLRFFLPVPFLICAGRISK